MTGRYTPQHIWRPHKTISMRYSRRALVVFFALILAIIAVGITTMVTGQYDLGLTEILASFQPDADPVNRMVVLGLRLPRLLGAIGVGMALGIAGCIFQSIARNPLASPDIIGFTTGTATGALLIILVAGQSGTAIAVGALIGGFATAILVYLVALDRGVIGNPLIVVGIAIGAMFSALNDYLLTRAELERAQVAKTWLFGSLHATPWPTTLFVAAGCLIVIPAIVFLTVRLRTLELGDDLAAGLGVPVKRSKMLLLALAVILTAVAIAGAGPIGFVALAAPQLAIRLSASAGASPINSALMGGLLVATADLAAQRLLAPLELPVGLLTGALGGAYLVWLLAREWKHH